MEDREIIVKTDSSSTTATGCIGWAVLLVFGIVVLTAIAFMFGALS